MGLFSFSAPSTKKAAQEVVDEPVKVEVVVKAPVPSDAGPAQEVDYESLDTDYKLPNKKKKKKAKVAEEFAGDVVESSGEGNKTAAKVACLPPPHSVPLSVSVWLLLGVGLGGFARLLAGF